MKRKTIEKAALSLSFMYIILCFLSILYPDSLWGFHFLSFLPQEHFLLFLILSLGIFLLQFFKINIDFDYQYTIKTPQIIGIAIIGGLLIAMFPVIEDYYGDAYKYIDIRKQLIPIIPEGTKEALLSYSFNAAAGEQTILALVTYIGYFFNTTYENAFSMMNVLFGSLFIYRWISFVNKELKLLASKIIMISTGLVSPLMLFFFGHLEIYAPVYFLILSWITLAINYSKAFTWKKASILLLLLIVCIKVHAIAILFFPILLYMCVCMKIEKNMAWKHATYYIFIPIMGLGVLLYFFILKDHIDNRSFNEGRIYAYEHLFLPLISPEAPLDNYNMLSLNHIFDYFNMLLSWSPAALIIILSIIFSKSKNIRWQSPNIIISGIALLLFIALFFVINPLISMPRDWDLFSIPAILLLVFSCVLLQLIEKEIITKQVVFTIASVVVLMFSVFAVHFDRNALADRLESVSTHVFGTYYSFSSEAAEFSIQCRKSPSIFIENNKRLIHRFKPKARKGIDYEFSNLLFNQANAYLKEKDFTQALNLYHETLEYYPLHNRSKLRILEINFILGNFEKAFIVSQDLIKLGYPSNKKAHRIALHCAIEANMYEEALKISSFYTQNWKGSFIDDIHKRLVDGENIHLIKKAFKGAN